MASSLSLIGRVQRLRKLKAQLAIAPPSRSTELRAKTLGRFIPAISRQYAEPRHLSPLLAELSGLYGASRRLCVSVPPRHGKSETLLHFIAWILLLKPSCRILYVTHTRAFALKQSKAARRLARLAGVRISDESNRGDEWETTSGGGLTARGIDGDITGRGFDIILVDDPVKGIKAAESGQQRESLFSWFTSDVFTRLTPTGSIVVVHTRWHVDDLIGRLVKDRGYDRLNIRAIAEPDNDNRKGPQNDNWRDPRKPGDPLWPEGGWTLKVLADRERNAGPYNWYAQYQGEPRPRGGNVFGEPSFYDELPKRAYRVAFGVDLAYSESAQRRADYSVLIELWREETKDPKRPLYYVVNVLRKQVDAPGFALTLKARATDRPGVRMHWHYAGPEKGIAQFFTKRGIPLRAKPAVGDPFQRSQEFAAAWNAGDVLVPNTEKFPDAEEWLPLFLDELGDFTGVKDKHDDQVVAGASAFDALRGGTAAPEMPGGGGGNGSRWDNMPGRGFG